ncbi:MAG TPA: ornithine cyclodeaminase family protein [Rhodothermales bacterium]|nr:ornithine cyclodeaminase family protein [Rhodothermales bacterium]
MMRTREIETLLLSGDDVRCLVRRTGLDETMDVLIGRLRRAFMDYDTDAVTVPVRDGFSYRRPETGLIEWMPCYSVGSDVAIKVVGYHPSNPSGLGLPTVLSTISLYDTASGHLMCVMDATILTALRTGAASAIATDLMSPPGSIVLGIVGAGTQAVAQVHAISRIRDLDRILVHDIDSAAAESFARRVARYLKRPNVRVADPDTISSESDVLCTATSVEPGQGPVIRDGDVNSRLHINAVGSDFPGKIELPVTLLRRSVVIPDFLAQAVKEGECQQLRANEIAPELHVLMQHPKLQADLDNRLTVFDSTGWALEDSVAMHVMVELARDLNIGSMIPMESVSEDPLDPYRDVASVEFFNRTA